MPNNRDPLSLKINGGKIGSYKDDEFSGIQRIYPIKEIKKDILDIIKIVHEEDGIVDLFIKSDFLELMDSLIETLRQFPES